MRDAVGCRHRKLGRLMNAFAMWQVMVALQVIVVVAIIVGATIWVRRMLRIGRAREAAAAATAPTTPEQTNGPTPVV